MGKNSGLALLPHFGDLARLLYRQQLISKMLVANVNFSRFKTRELDQAILLFAFNTFYFSFS